MDVTVDAIDVFVGLDVGKEHHHAVALDRAGNQLLSTPLPNMEAALRSVLTAVQAQGTVLVVVDQPATIGALPVAVAQAMGITVAYLPGLTMRRMADTLPGTAKTDARDAFVIATTARTAPHTLRALTGSDEQMAALKLACGADAILVTEHTATVNRLRGLLTQLHPALERVLGPRLDRHGVLALLQQWPTPQMLAAAGPAAVATFLTAHGSRKALPLATAIAQSLAAQTVVVAGTTIAARIIPQLAALLQLQETHRAALAEEVEQLIAVHPLFPVLISLPGIGVRTAAVLLFTVVGKDFGSAAQLASYAGVAPVTRRSGSSIRGEHASRRGNKVLKDALYCSSFSALKHPPSRAYYDRKRAEGKRHTQALLCLTRRRIDVLYAMIRDATCYQDPTSSTP
jgi:transposase